VLITGVRESPGKAELFEVGFEKGRLSEVKLDQEKGCLDIHLDFPPGTRFTHPASGEPAPIYDTRERTWRHLNFCQYECYLHAWVPRVEGGEESGTKTVEVPWARPGSGFTRLTDIPAEAVNGLIQTKVPWLPFI
jgi:transposase